MQEFDADLAQKIKHERFRWHNFQWLEMTTGESLYEEETDDLDKDYLDPSYLHTAAELYNNPDLYYDMQSQFEAAHSYGGHPSALMMSAPAGYPFRMSEEDVGSYQRDGNPSTGGRTRTLSGGYNPLTAQGATGRQHYHQQQMPWSEAEFVAMADREERDEDTLSPRQYALLMQSMQEPLAMYASTLDPNVHQGGDRLDSDDDDLGFEDGGFGFDISGRGSGVGSERMRWQEPGAVGQFASGAASEEYDLDPMMLYNPAAVSRYNPSPNYAHPTAGRMMMRSPVPPAPPTSTGDGASGYYGNEYELEVHPATAMSSPMAMGYPGGSGQGAIRMPVPPPPPSSAKNRPPTRQGF